MPQNSPADHELVESHSLEFVPPADRHGRVIDLFTLWFGTNIAPLPVVTGALALRVYGLSLGWGITAIVTGHALGAAVLGLCSAEGPQLGVPQMLQSRGQFGRYGALLVVGFAAVIYVGFFISNIILASHSINAIFPRVTATQGALLAGAGAALIGILGYNFIHFLNRMGTWVMGSAIVIGYGIIIQRLPVGFAARGGVSLSGWLGTMSLAVTWQISYACYTSDYSRYLPSSVGKLKPFLATYLGALAGTSLSFVFGALVALASPVTTAPMLAVRDSIGVMGPILLFLFILNVVSHNALNIYGATLSIMTSIQTFASRFRAGRTARVLLSSVILLTCSAVAVGAASNFISQFMRFILTMLIVLVPWATINILDFYIVTRGVYEVQDFFAADGGRYGFFKTHAIIAYVLGILIQLPFVVTPVFTGPVARALHGADLSWFVAPLIVAPVYLWLERRRRTLGDAPSIAARGAESAKV